MRKTRVWLPVLGVVAAMSLAACGSSSNDKSSSSSSSSPSASSSSSSASGAVDGKGAKVGIILPDTTSSPRWITADPTALKQDCQTYNLSCDIQNAGGSASKMQSIAQQMTANKVKVLMIVNLDPASGAKIEKEAAKNGVIPVDYDRLTPGGGAALYVSFDNVKVGKLMGQGLVSCVTDWGVKNPNVIVMKGSPTDNNATLFAQGYDSVLAPFFASGAYKFVSVPPGSWDANQSRSEFEEQFTAHKSMNAALTPNDANAAAIISYLQSQGVRPRTFPTTGQDASLSGLQNILAGYQCGTVYKPIYLEAGATAALAMYLRAGRTPPPSLVNGSVTDVVSQVPVPSILANPEWVTAASMKDTVIKDNFVTAAQLCTGQYAAECKAAGISG